MLTTAQKTTLKNAINADAALAPFVAIADWPAIAIELNKLASPAFPMWRSDAPVQSIYDAITWTNYTPVDTPDLTATFTNRVLVIQTKQMNLQNILQGRSSIDAGKANVRAGLRDAVVGLPAGVAGASVSAGGASGVTVLTACTRSGLYIEKILAGASATTGTVTANVLAWEGQIEYGDVQAAMV